MEVVKACDGVIDIRTHAHQPRPAPRTHANALRRIDGMAHGDVLRDSRCVEGVGGMGMA